MQRQIVLAAAFLASGWTLADARAVGAEPDAAGSQHSAYQSEVPPDKWSTTLLQWCLDLRAQDDIALAELDRTIRENTRSAENLAFAEKERRARAKVLAAEQKRYFARLSFFLLGDRARSLRPGEAKPAQGPDPLQQSLKLLFGDATACEMEAFQATLLFAYFNVPFTEARLKAASANRRGISADQDEACRDQKHSEACPHRDATLADEIVLRDVEHGLHNQAVQGAEASYRSFDREKSRRALAYPRDLMRRLRRIASNEVAAERAKHAVAGPDDRTRFQSRLEQQLRQSADLSDTDLPTREDRELAALLNRLNTYIDRAAEPARIRTYVHARTDEFEGALRTAIPEKQVHRLESLIDETLFPTEAALVILQSQTIDQTIASVNTVVDRWFRQDALPAIEKSLFNDPFSAYWFFVQTGGLPRGMRPYAGSRLTLTSGVEFSLDRLRGDPTADLVNHLFELRIPGNFSDEYAALEQELRETTVTRQYALEMVANAKHLSAATKGRLLPFLQSPQETDIISTIDVYRWVIADSNKVHGSIDRGLVRAGLELMCGVKAEQLDTYLERLRQANPSEEGQRLVAYLRNAGEMLLELESRQGTDGRFHQGTEAGAVGWLFGGFLFGNTVPIQLWVPGGVNGQEFAELMNELSPKNKKSNQNYEAKEATRIALVHDGVEHLETAEGIIDRAENFVNVAGFDWKRDAGGRRLTYRVMAKKLGIVGSDFDEFLEIFGQGLRLDPDAQQVTRFYDIPAPLMKNLLVFQLFKMSPSSDLSVVREALARLGGEFECSTVRTCGDLSPLAERAGRRYDPQRAAGDAEYAAAWQTFRTLQGLFEKREPDWDDTGPRASLSAYLDDGDNVRRFVNRFGLHRRDMPGTPLPINIVVDGKQSLIMNSTWGFAGDPPYLRDTPINDLYEPLLEFGCQVVLWKGVLEFPWHIGPVPVPGRKVFGKIPMPFIPYPWLAAVPGFGWAGTGMSLFLQFAAATDPRNWWAMVSHVKHFSNEREAMESGLGIGSKYNNEHQDFKTWHDMGVVIEGPIVDDANDYFVWIFNQARMNNSGNAGSKGVRIRKLAYADYRWQGVTSADGMRNPSWFITTHPEHADFNYRAALLSALAAAQDNIYLESSFFSDPVVPRMLIRKAREFRARVNCAEVEAVECSQLRREAVQIHLILPGASDKPVLDTVATAEFHEMLHLGVKIYRWDPPEHWSATKMLHTKAWLVDYEPGLGGLAYVGSSNATQRSHILDEEAGIVSTSPAFADDVYTRLFAPDIHRDSRVETAENFHVTRSTNAAVRSGRWMRRFLLALFFI